MNTKKKSHVTLLCAVISLFLWAPSAFSITVDEIAQEFTCQCGCNMLVSACEGTMECSTAADIKAQIVTQLNQGQSKEEIIASFVMRHGEKILSSPTKRGFNLTAWVLPFIAVIFGMGALYVRLKIWSSRAETPRREQVSFNEEDKGYMERVEKELKTFEG